MGSFEHSQALDVAALSYTACETNVPYRIERARRVVEQESVEPPSRTMAQQHAACLLVPCESRRGDTALRASSRASCSGCRAARAETYRGVVMRQAWTGRSRAEFPRVFVSRVAAPEQNRVVSLLSTTRTLGRSQAGQRHGRHDASRRVEAKSTAVETRARLSDCAPSLSSHQSAFQSPLTDSPEPSAVRTSFLSRRVRSTALAGEA